ncbi:MAG: YdcF family protein [Clostridia bacterium]|nr:YdcF family protein [Clostridia bacterium]
MSKKICIITGIILAVFCAAFVIFRGDTYTVAVDAAGSAAAEDYDILTDHGESILKIADKRISGGKLKITLRSVAPGKESLSVLKNGETVYLNTYYVHRFGVITENHFWGRSSGDFIIPVSAVIFLAAVLYYLITVYRAGMAKGLYSYVNTGNLAVVIFVSLILAVQTVNLITKEYGGFIGTVRDVLGSAGSFAFVILPLAAIVSILVAVSNINLMRKEGVNPRNMLGFFLAVLLLAGTFFPDILYRFLRTKTNVNIYNESGAAVFLLTAVENIVYAAVAYLECVLLATVIIAVKAARRIPAFDKDYILILGCKIRADGSLTNLLRDRADRALDFAKTQKEKTGKDIIFVPSGGQGADEVMPEAAAIRNYLVEQGVDESNILVEDTSKNTYENFKNSMELIRENSGNDESKIAFSTTNYHVFRSGLTVARQGIKAQGVGSRTKAYFWINAFIREFIATLYAQRKKHIKVIALIFILTLFTVTLVFISGLF